MDLQKLKDELFRDEGYVRHAYPDSLSFLTIGIGRMIDKRKGGGITKDEAYYLLGNDIKNVEADLDRSIPWWRTLSENRQRALANMCFQMGIGNSSNGLLSFSRSLQLIREKKWEDAAAALKLSNWYKQTPVRAARVIEMIRVG